MILPAPGGTCAELRGSRRGGAGSAGGDFWTRETLRGMARNRKREQWAWASCSVYPVLHSLRLLDSNPGQWHRDLPTPRSQQQWNPQQESPQDQVTASGSPARGTPGSASRPHQSPSPRPHARAGGAGHRGAAGERAAPQHASLPWTAHCASRPPKPSDLP